MVGMITQPYRRPNDFATDNYLVTLSHEYDLAGVIRKAGLESQIDLSDFLTAHPNGKARIWAVGVSAPAKRAWEKMRVGDLVLFYGANEVYAYGILSSKIKWDGNNKIWPSGTNWDHIYSVTGFTELAEGKRLNYQSLRKITPKLDVQSVGYRNLSELGVSIEKVIEFVRTTGQRSERPTPVRRNSFDLFGLSRKEIENAIVVYDSLGRETFLTMYGLNAAAKYFIKFDKGDPRDAKAIIDFALKQRNLPSDPKSPTEWNGDKRTVAEPLQRLGFDVISTWQNVAKESKKVENYLEEFGFQADKKLLGVEPSALKQALENIDGPLERIVMTRARTEQSALRRYLLGNKKQGECMFCGRKMDAELLVAAHIKKRSKCSDDERRDLKNIVMLNCRFGCDELYGRGYLAVTKKKETAISKVLDDEVALDYIETYVEPSIEAKAGQMPYFKWHYVNDFQR
jgi:hypothetical protein